MNRKAIAAVALIALVAAGIVYFARTGPTPAEEQARESVPDFAAIKNVSEKKKRFFDFMLPKVRHANARVIKDRRALLEISDKIEAGHDLTRAETRLVSHLRERYQIKPDRPRDSALRILLARVDVVPASLMLAQSATESAWGTSRFARQGNNFFGIWCFTPGCGMTPKYRDEGLTHEVKTFDSVQASVDHYLQTINTNVAYQHLRTIRARERYHNRPLRGIDLARGLRNYSERRDDYVHDIQQMIRYNHLWQYTRHPLQASADGQNGNQ